MNNAVMKISIMGNYPPPVGGISTHIKQLSHRLFEEGLLEALYCYLRDELSDDPPYLKCGLSRNKIILRYGPLASLVCVCRQLMRDKSDIVHFHHAPVWESFSFLILLIFSPKKIVITVHDQFQLMEKQPWLFKKGFELLLKYRRRTRWIAVNEIIRRQILQLGVPSEHIMVLPAYLGISNGDVLPAEIQSFLDGKILKISFYAYAMSMCGHDMYGIYQTIEVAKLLRNSIPDFGLVMSIPNCPSIKEIEKLIVDYGLETNILVYQNALPSLIPLFKESDIYLRPTTTDGDSVSIREALDSHCIVIASDAVSRISPCITYKINDLSDMLNVLLYVSQNLDCIREQVESQRSEGVFDKMVTFYHSLNES